MNPTREKYPVNKAKLPETNHQIQQLATRIDHKMLQSVTGGNIPIPGFHTGLDPNMASPRDSDSHSNFNTSSDDFPSKEKLPSSGLGSLVPLSGLSRPRTFRTTNETHSLYISRSRFIIRLVSTLASVGIVAGIASAYIPYYATKDSGLIYAGRYLWPEYMDMKPSNIMLAVGCTASLFSGGLLVAGLFPKVRHVTRTSDILALVVASIGLPLGVVGAYYLYWYNAHEQTFLSWTCDNTQIDHPEVQFRMVCGEVRFAFAMSWTVTVAETLMFINVLLGCVLVKRKGETRIGV